MHSVDPWMIVREEKLGRGRKCLSRVSGNTKGWGGGISASSVIQRVKIHKLPQNLLLLFPPGTYGICRVPS